MNEPITPDLAVSPRLRQALLSLQQSRLALRAELTPPAAPAPRPGMPGALARLWWRRLRAWPAGRLATEAMQQWWRHQPWQPLGDALIGETRQQLWPLLRRHPWATVGVAAPAAAALVALRPWRWHWVDRQARRAPGAAGNWLMRQLMSAPVQAAILGLLAMAAQRARTPPPTADPQPTPASTGSPNAGRRAH